MSQMQAEGPAVMKLELAKLAPLAVPSKAHAVRHWLFTLGGPGLILLGLIDSSVIPVPGSMDTMTVVLAAHDRELWPYYAVMATVGSVMGAYLTYRIARDRGEKALKDKVSPRNVKKVTKAFERWGFGAIVVPAILPPPMPMVPFVIAAGALQYSPKKFLAAMSAGRILRYCILAYLGASYGRKIFQVILAHGTAVLIVTMALAVTAALVIVLLHFRRKRGALANVH
jgi:membrane protein YqaA with SNARE-associated domain